MLWIFLVLALAVLVIGTYTDLRTKEVPDWVNFGLIFAGIGIHAILSAVSSSWLPIISSGIGLGIGVGVSFAMYYLGQWGGGDAKMLMGLGAIIGFDLSNLFFLNFLINVFFIGAVYGLCYGVYLAFRNRKSFGKTFRHLYSKIPLILRRGIFVLLGLAVAFAILFLSLKNMIFIYLISLMIILIGFYYLFIYAKTIEKCCMLKYVSPSKLTEGDWIAKDVKYKGKYITGPKDLGISKKQINLLKKFKIEKVLMKDGIPFVPSFLIAFVFTLFLGNILWLLISIL